jgi:hypothetical protein
MAKAETLTKERWQNLAEGYAMCDGAVDLRIGVWCDSARGALIVVNNNPYADYPDLRDRQLTDFRKWLAAANIQELAYATHPPVGELNAGYSFAMILDAGEKRREEVLDWWEEASRFKRLPWINDTADTEEVDSTTV